jgi:hypothetical protein
LRGAQANLMELTALKKPGPLPFFVQTAFSDAPAARL